MTQCKLKALVECRPPPGAISETSGFFCIRNMIQIFLNMLSRLPLARPKQHTKFNDDLIITFGVMSTRKPKSLKVRGWGDNPDLSLR